MNIHQKFINDFGIISVSKLIQRLRPIIFIPLITKTIGEAQYGIFVFMIAIVGFVQPFARLGLGRSVVRYTSGEDDTTRADIYYSALVVVLGTALITALLLFLTAELVSGELFNSTSQRVIYIIILYILISTITKINTDFFKASRRMVVFSSLKILDSVGGVALGALLILNGGEIFHLLIALTTAKLTVFVVSLFIIIQEIGINFPSFTNLQTMLSYGVPLVPTNLSSWSLRLSDRYFVGFFLGATSVGVYSVAYGLGFFAIQILSAPLTVILLPSFTKLWKENNQIALQTQWQQSINYMLCLGIPAIAGLTILSEPLLSVLSTSQIAQEGSILIPIVATAGLFEGLYTICSKIYHLEERTQFELYLKLTAAFINTTINIALIPRYGYIIAGISTLLSLCIITVPPYIRTRNVIKAGIDIGLLTKILAATAIMMALLMYMPPINGYLTFGIIAVGVIAYTISFIIILRVTRDPMYNTIISGATILLNNRSSSEH